MRDGMMKKVVGGAALLGAGMLVLYATTLSATLESKNLAQASINQRLTQHLKTYQLMQARADGWDAEYQSMENAKDLLGLYQALDLERFGLVSPLNDFRLTKVLPYQQNGVSIGLVQVCMATGGGGLAVQAQDYESLLGGLDKMANSPYVRFSGAIIEGEKQQANARLADVCMLLRDEKAS